MNEIIKRGPGRPRTSKPKATIASLEKELHDLKAQGMEDTQKMFDLLYELGEQFALKLTGKDERE